MTHYAELARHPTNRVSLVVQYGDPVAGGQKTSRYSQPDAGRTSADDGNPAHWSPPIGSSSR
jgi:hypothetical protein